LALAFPAEKLRRLNPIEFAFPSRLCALALSLYSARFEAITLIKSLLKNALAAVLRYNRKVNSI
jgi:hypothetical protein